MPRTRRFRALVIWLWVSVLAGTAQQVEPRPSPGAPPRLRRTPDRPRGEVASFPAESPKQKFAPDRLLVRFKPGVGTPAQSAVHAAAASRPIHSFHHVPNLQLVQIPAGTSMASALNSYRSNPAVLYAEPDYKVQLFDTQPNDPLFNLQWAFKNTGDNGGTPGADIGISKAWDLTTGSDDVVVGLLDTGVAYDQPDIAGNIYSNPAECPANGVDDDGNGYIDDCHGLNTVLEDAPNSDPYDWIGHGTHVAGTMGAVTNNGLGVAGVNWHVKILPCKFIGWEGGLISRAVQCLDYIADMKDRGVNIVATNNSWGGFYPSRALQDAIQNQLDHGILFIAAAGNGNPYGIGQDNDLNGNYPSNIDLPNMIAVAATDRADRLATFSNFGLHSVHLGAPGVDIMSTFGNFFWDLSGTSMATPHVTGTAALLKAYDPTLDWKGIKNRILAGGDPDPNLDQTVTGRRLNVYGAMTCSGGQVAGRLEPRQDMVTAALHEPISLAAQNIDCDRPGGQVLVTVTETGDVITLADDGVAPDLIAGDGIYTATWTPPALGQYTLHFPGGDDATVRVLKPYSYSTTTSEPYRVFTGTNLNLEDERVAPVSPPFPIHFGGQTFDTFYVSDNGVLAFDRPFGIPYPVPIPYVDAGTLIAPYWMDYAPVYPSSNNVFWGALGTAPNRELAVEWRNVFLYGLGPDFGFGPVTFQVVFREGSDTVLFNYSDVDFACCGNWDNGGGQTFVGIQVSPHQGTQYSTPGINTHPLNAGTSIRWDLADADFGFSVASPVLSAYPGQNVAFTGKVSSLYAFKGDVQVACIGGPPVCNPTTVTASTLGVPFSVQAGASTPGQYNFQLQATSSAAPGLAHTQPVTLNVGDFTIAAPQPATLTIPNGSSASATVRVSSIGTFSSPVSLSCSGLPPGATCSFSPAAAVTPSAGGYQDVTITVRLTPQTALGDSTATITASAPGASAPKTQSLPIKVAAAPDFILSAIPSPISSNGVPNASTTLGVASQDGYAASVQLSCAVVPLGPACQLSSSSVSSFPASVGVSLSLNGAPAINYDIVLTGTDGSATHSLHVPWIAADYNVAMQTYATLYSTVNAQIPYTVTANGGYKGTVLLSCDASAMGPPAASCWSDTSQISFSSAPVLFGTLNVFIPAGLVTGTYPLYLHTRDASGTAVRDFVVQVTVRGFTWKRGAVTEQTLLPGDTSDPFQLIFTPFNGYDLATNAQPWSCNPASATCSLAPSPIIPDGNPATVEMRVSVPLDGPYTGGGSASFPVMATTDSVPDVFNGHVWMPPDGNFTIHIQDFSLLPSTDLLTMVLNKPATMQITYRAAESFSAPVTLACPDDLPSGLLCSFDRNPLAPGDVATLTLQATQPIDSLRNLQIQGTAEVSGRTLVRSFSMFYAVGDFFLELEPTTITVKNGDVAYYVLSADTDFTGSNPPYTPQLSCNVPDPGITCETDPSFVIPGATLIVVRPTPGVATPGPHAFAVQADVNGEVQSVTGSLVVQGNDSLILTTPNGYELWSSGAQTIIWKYSGNPGTSVRLELLNHDSFVQTIATGLPIGSGGKGNYVWNIPESLPFSQYYKVRIVSEQNASISDTSDIRVWMGRGVDIDYFTWTPDAYYVGDFMPVTYTWSAYGSVRLDLYRNGILIRNVATEEVSGYFDGLGWMWATGWWVSNDLPVGGGYTVKLVPTADPSRAVMSRPFTIYNNSIQVTSPATSEVWLPGSTHTIAWKWTGNPTKDVRIDIGPVTIPTVPIGVNGQGSYTWTVPLNMPSRNDYVVAVSSYNFPFTSGNSGNFAIGNFHTLKVINTNPSYGSVSSSPQGIQCGISSVCSFLFPSGTQVTLNVDTYGNTFYGWTGDCVALTISCSVSMEGNRTVVANTNPHGLITVSSPTWSQQFTPGTAVPISWVYSGAISGTVTIQLLQAGQLVQTLSTNASLGSAGTGSFAWTAPNLPLRQDYAIRVISNSDNMVYGTGGTFWIKGTGILVTYPNQNTMQTGTTAGANWYYGGNIGTAVRVDLYRSGTFVQTIAASVPIGNSGLGQLNWMIPTPLADDTTYSLRVTSISSPGSFGDSRPFAIWTPGLTLLSPLGGEGWRPGSTHRIQWSSKTDANSATIELWKGGVLDSTVAVRAALWGSGFDWAIPPQLAPASNYQIKVRTEQLPTYVALSGAFSIGDYRNLSVSKGSSQGSGVITSAESRIQCGRNCAADFPAGTLVTLSAVADPGSFFSGWGGACSSAGTNPNCTLTLNADSPVIAQFGVSDFSIATASPVVSVAPGAAAHFDLTLTPVSQFSGQVSLSCNNPLPAGISSCAFSPNSALALSGTPQVVSLSVTSASSAVLGDRLFGVTASGGGKTHQLGLELAIRDFQVSTTPATNSVQAGAGAQYNFTVNPLGGMTDPVVVSCGTLPAGVSCVATPGAVVPGATPNNRTVVTLQTTLGVTPASTISIPLTGTGIGVVRSSNVTLSVKDFTLTPSAGTALTNLGTNATKTILVKGLNGFTGAVALGCEIEGTPAGTSCTLSNANPLASAAGTSVTATITSNAGTTPQGTYTVDITGTNSGQEKQTTFSVQIKDFTLALGTNAITIPQPPPGQSSSLMVPITLTAENGFNTSTALSCTGQPTGVTCAFAPASGIPTAIGLHSTLTVTSTSTVALNTYHLTVKATAGTLIRTQALDVTDFGPNFTQAVAPTTQNVTSGASVQYTVTYTSLGGMNQDIAVGCGTLPTGVHCAAVPPIVTPGTTTGNQSVVTLSTDFGAAVTANDTIAIIGVSSALNNLTRSTNVTLSVKDFTLTQTTTSVSTNVGTSATHAILVKGLNSFTGNVALGCVIETAPAGTACALSSVTPAASAAGTSVTATISSNAGSTAPGTYTVDITGTNSAQSKTISFTVTVKDFTLALGTNAITIPQPPAGQSSSMTVPVTLTAQSGFNTSTALSCSGQPTGVTCAFLPASGIPTALGLGSTLTVTSTSTVAHNTYHLTVKATAGTLIRTQALDVTDFGPNFTQAVAPTTQSVVNGSAAQYTVTYTLLGGMTQDIAVNCGTLPAGVTCTPVPAIVNGGTSGPGPNQSVVTLQTTFPTTPAANATIAITGTSAALNNLTRSTNVTLGVKDFTVTANSSNLATNVGTNVTDTILVKGVNGFTGNVALACVIVGTPAGTACNLSNLNPSATSTGTSVTATITSNAATTPIGTYTVQVTGTGVNGAKQAAPIRLNFKDFSLAVGPATQTISATGSTVFADYTVTATSLGMFGGNVLLSCASPLPAGVSCGFGPSHTSTLWINPTQAGLNVPFRITVTGSTAPHTYNLKIQGNSSALVHQEPVELNLQ